ncbi:MAG: translesion DNA synthesis-associated protein ImuA [Pseudomonadota bacterium]
MLRGTTVWRANTLSATKAPTCPTGIADLDACLPGGGWPVAGLTELLSTGQGVGELQLLMPALSELAATRAGWITCISPPYLLNAPALAQWGISPQRLLLIHPRSAADAAWAAEQALASGTCIAVLLWTDALESARNLAPRKSYQRLSMQQLTRRLQLSAAANGCWAVALRKSSASRQPSAAVLRLLIEANGSQRDLHVLKVRGGRPAVIKDIEAHIDADALMIKAMSHATTCATDD